MSKTPFLININFAQITAKGNICNKFDYDVIESMYETYDEDNNPIVYNFLYKYLLQLSKDKISVVFSPDPAISASSIAANAEKYMYIQPNGNNAKYLSNLKIIYLTSTPHLLTDYDDVNVENFSHSIISNLVCSDDITFTKHKLALESSQFILIGINDNIINELQREQLNNSNVTYFTLDQVRKKGIKNVFNSVKDIIGDDPVHIIFDLSATAYETAPCVTRFLDLKTSTSKLNGFSTDELQKIFTQMPKNNIVGLDITGYDFRINDKERAHRITCEIAKLPLAYLLKIKEKKINVFNENSSILIWRPTDKVSEDDIGWFILRGVSLEIREQLISALTNDKIITFSIEDDNGEEQEVLISTTTMAEQETKIYGDESLGTLDCVLFCEEKVNMMFELLNTDENSLISDLPGSKSI